MLETSSLIPVYGEIIADMDTPLTLFAKVAGEHRHIFLFESMEGGEKWGRYSFIGFDPLLTFVSAGDKVTISEAGRAGMTVREVSANPLQALRDLVGEMEAAEYEGLPRFCGGAVGFLGYDMVRFMEELPDDRPDHGLPDSSFMIPRIVLVYDSLKQKVTVVCWVKKEQGDSAAELYGAAISAIEEVIRRLRLPVPPEFAAVPDTAEAPAHSFTANMEKSRFCEMVERAKEYILAGDIIQVVLSQRFHTVTELPPTLIYRALRHINPSPYLFYLQQAMSSRSAVRRRSWCARTAITLNCGRSPAPENAATPKRKTGPWSANCWPTPKSGRST